jgi:hypothetical protein
MITDSSEPRLSRSGNQMVFCPQSLHRVIGIIEVA